jgi:iron(III) transport system ATP-binding protein
MRATEPGHEIATTADPRSVPAASRAPGAYIQVRGLSKSFGDSLALRQLDLDVQEGEFLVLLGPSGCGKSTTMRSLVGLEMPDAGSIRVAGRTLFDVAQAIDVPPNKRDMGMVFQSYALWPHKSVFQNVAFPLQMKRVARAEIRSAVADVLTMVGLKGYEKRSIATLSGGQMQRVALARGVVMRPKILLLDEPLSNLDARLRVALRHELKEIQQTTGLTTIYVTHDQDEALGLADRIVVMQRGRIAQQGAPEDIFRRPATPFVADFLGMSNRYAGVVTSGSNGHARLAVEETGLTILGSDARLDPSRPEATACLRPESLRLVTEDARGSATGNEWPAKVLSRQYQGSSVRYHVELADGPSVFVDTPAGVRLEPGDACLVAADPDDVLLLQEAVEAEEA